MAVISALSMMTPFRLFMSISLYTQTPTIKL